MKAYLLLLATILFGLSFASCKSPSPDKTSTTGVADIPAQKNICKVIELPTDDASAKDPDDTAAIDFKYPSTTDIKVPDNFKDCVNIYGASYKLWLAPAMWTGNGNLFTNGGMCVHLHPIGDEALSGAFIHYSEERRDQTTILTDAAPYFKDALDEYNATMNEDRKNPVKTPQGIEITKVSETLVTYILPQENDLLIKGIVVYGVDDDDNNGDPVFQEMKFAFPKSESKMLDFLMAYYVKKIQE